MLLHRPGKESGAGIDDGKMFVQVTHEQLAFDQIKH